MEYITMRQRRFVEAFFTSRTATEAARRAGYKDGSSIWVTASRLLRNAKVQRAIAHRMGRILDIRDLDAVVEKIAFGDKTDSIQLRAIELAYKRLDAFNRAKEEAEERIPIDLSGLSGEELHKAVLEAVKEAARK